MIFSHRLTDGTHWDSNSIATPATNWRVYRARYNCALFSEPNDFQLNGRPNPRRSPQLAIIVKLISAPLSVYLCSWDDLNDFWCLLQFILVNRSIYTGTFWIIIQNKRHIMQILQVTQRIITIFGMCTLPNGSDFRIHSRQIIVMLVSLIIMVQLNLFSVFYVVEHLIGEDLRSSTFAMMQVIAIFSTIASFASLIYHKKSVRRFFERLQAIVTQCKYPIFPFFLNFSIFFCCFHR